MQPDVKKLHDAAQALRQTDAFRDAMDNPHQPTPPLEPSEAQAVAQDSASEMTLEQFQNLSSEQRKAMPVRESGRFYAQMALLNLNHNAMAQEPLPQAQVPLIRSAPKEMDVQSKVHLREPTDWPWTAITYQKRLENIAWFVAFSAYCASVYWLGSLLEYFRVDSVWTETIGMVVWLPLGFVAYCFKNWLEDWLVRVDAKR